MAVCLAALLASVPISRAEQPAEELPAVLQLRVGRVEEGIQVDWRMRGSGQSNPVWWVDVRSYGQREGLQRRVIGFEAETGCDVDSVGYAVTLGGEWPGDHVDVRLWTEGTADNPREFLGVPVREASTLEVSSVRRGTSAIATKALTTEVHGATRVRVTIREAGVYRIGADRIAAVLADTTEEEVRGWIAATNLAVTCMGQPVAWHPDGENEGVVFLGEAYRDVFTEDNVYWLGPGPGLRMAEQTAAVPSGEQAQGSFWETRRFEQDNGGMYTFPYEFLPAEFPLDLCYWDYLLSPVNGSPRNATLAFQSPGAVESATGSFRVWYRSRYSSVGTGGTLRLVLGDQMLGGEFPMDGLSNFTLEAAVPQALLAQGALKVQIGQKASVNTFFVIDSLTLTYRRWMAAENGRLRIVLDEGSDRIVADGFSPGGVDVYAVGLDGGVLRLLGAGISVVNGAARCAFGGLDGIRTYVLSSEPLVPSGVEGVAPNPWSGAAHEVDYLVVAPEAFLPSLEPLLTYRSASLRVGVLTTEVLYGHYNGGRFSPYALREFVRDSRSWSVAPSMVLLAGHGHYDYRRLMGSPSWLPNFIPPGLVKVPYRSSASGHEELVVGSDNDLVDLDGDGVPDVAIGRLPARTVAEMGRMVAKTLAYEAGRSARTNAYAFADAKDSHDGQASDRIAKAWTNRLPRAISAVQTSALHATDADRLRVRSLTWSQINGGTWLTAYFGHASQWSIGYTSKHYLQHSEVGLLQNKTRPGLFLGTTCRMNNFATPNPQEASAGCVGAELLRSTDGGMVAVLAPASPSFNEPGELVAAEFLEAFAKRRRRYAGEAVKDSLEALRDSTDSRVAPLNWLSRTMVFLGDPALDVRPAAGILQPEGTLLRIY